MYNTIIFYIKYDDFLEVLDLDLREGFVDISVSEIIYDSSRISNLLSRKAEGVKDFLIDFSSNWEETYLAYMEKGRTVLVVQKNSCIYCFINSKVPVKIKVSSRNLIDLVITNKEIVKNLSKKYNEDYSILISALINDFNRNDYAVSDLNRLVKFLKLFFISKYLRENYSIIQEIEGFITDETLIGDIDISNLAMSLSELRVKLLEFGVLERFDKVLKRVSELDLLGKRRYHYKFKHSLVNFYEKNYKGNLFFRNENKHFNYTLDTQKNYRFDFNDEQFELSIGKENLAQVNEVLFIYNGDVNDPMIF